MNFGHYTFKVKQSAFSLIELMISMAIGVFLILILTGYFKSSASSHRAAASIAQLQNTGRTAMDMISRSIRSAGYLGLFVKSAELGSMVRGMPVNVTPNCQTGSTTWVAQLDFPIYGENNNLQANACVPADIQTEEEGAWQSDTITVRYASSETVNIDDAAAENTYHLRASLRDGMIFTGNNLQNADLVAPPFTTHRLVSEMYFVANGSQSCRGQNIPSLYRVNTNDAGVPTVVELLPGVERLELQYLIGNTFMNADEVTVDLDNDVNQWSQVSAIRVSILARSLCELSGESAVNEGETFNLVENNFTVPAGDLYERLELNATIALRNAVLSEVMPVPEAPNE